MNNTSLKFNIFQKKKNERANALNRRIDHMNSKKVFNHNIFKVNNDEILFANRYKVNMTFKIMRNDQEQFLIIHEKLQISKNKIDDYIREHHDKSLQNHLKIIKTIQFLRQNCQFSKMKQKIKIYIEKCLNC